MRVVTVVTGSRADFGLLRPIIRAMSLDPRLQTRVVVTGTHLLPPAHTAEEVAAAFPVSATVEMQHAGVVGRGADAVALGRGVAGFAELFGTSRPDVVLVLGDRIEAFAAAAAAAVAGVHVAHVHGGDRAEGIADEAMRHAITKLAHVHFPATASSTERIIAMGEDPYRTHLVGSPALDDLESFEPMPDGDYDALGQPEIVCLLHPTGEDDEVERTRAGLLLQACVHAGRTLALDPNHDPGRDGIIAAIEESGVPRAGHLPRPAFIGLIRRVRILVGNSSAGLIEAAAIPRRVVDVGSRQAGRERPRHVVTCPDWDATAIRRAIARALAEPVLQLKHPYGNGQAGPRIAAILARVDADNHPLVKRNTY